MLYCRVWRWPNILSHHELKPIPECLYPYDGGSGQICINPYHYQRIEQAPPLIAPSPPNMSSFQQQIPSGIISSPYAPSISPHSIPPSPASGYGGGSTHSSMIINISKWRLLYCIKAIRRLIRSGTANKLFTLRKKAK